MPDFLFYSPVGEMHERKPGVARPKGWINASPYAVLYRRGTPLEAYHTGIDYNKNEPVFDADAHSPVYACSGTEKYPSVVTYAQRFSPNWGWLVIARHYVTPTTFIYARYAHLENVRVKVGDLIYWDTQIGNVGRIDVNSPYHCHFDISPTDVLFRSPGDWPKLNRAYLLVHYADPEKFIREHGVLNPMDGTKMKVTSATGLYLVVNPARPIIPLNGEVMGYETQAVNGDVWQRVQLLDLEDDGWVLAKRANGDTLLAPVDPNETMEVTATNGVNRRRGPGTNFPTAPPGLPRGTIIQVRGTFSGAGSTAGWAEIVVNGQPSGLYVSRDFLKKA